MKTIILKLLFESLKAIFKKVSFAVVSERFLSRMLCYALRGIADKTTNELKREAAEAVIDSLKRPDLPEIK